MIHYLKVNEQRFLFLFFAKYAKQIIIIMDSNASNQLCQTPNNKLKSKEWKNGIIYVMKSIRVATICVKYYHRLFVYMYLSSANAPFFNPIIFQNAISKAIILLH
jgi:hypothetical protein